MIAPLVLAGGAAAAALYGASAMPSVVSRHEMNDSLATKFGKWLHGSAPTGEAARAIGNALAKSEANNSVAI